MTSLLTPVERKVIIDKMVDYDAQLYFSIAIGNDAVEAGKIRKHLYKVYSKWDDAKLLSVKFN